MFCQLVHVHVELLLECKKPVRYVLVTVPWDVEKGCGNWESTDKFAQYTDEIRVSLSLLQRLARVVAVRDDAFAVCPSFQCWRLLRGVDLGLD